MPPKILFLTLKIFGLTGGIEKVCRAICKSLNDLEEEQLLYTTVYCMHDQVMDLDPRYLKQQQYEAFNGNKKYFVVKSLIKGIRSDVVLLSHINLLSIGYLIKKFSPSTKVYLLTHGIEIWRPLPGYKLKALKSLDKIIAVSHFTAEKIKSAHQMADDKIQVLNNCLDPFYRFPPDFTKPKSLLERYGLTENHSILISLSRLSSSEKYKGYDNIIKIMPQLVKNNPNIVFLLAGRADEKERIRLENLITDYQIAAHVKLIGFIDEAEISDHFLLSDVFVMPSKKEGFGIVFIEAMASGLIAVAGNKDGSIDALNNGELGRLVDPDNLEEVAQVLAELLKKPFTDDQKLALQKKTYDLFNYEKYRHHIKNIVLNTA